MDERATKVAEVICQKTGVSMDDFLYLLEQVKQEQVQKTEEQILEMRIENLLKKMGFIPKVPAFQFLCRAIQLIYESYDNNVFKRKQLKDIYSQIGQEYEREALAVETTIRYLIKSNWHTLDIKMREQILGKKLTSKRSVATNKEFILGMAEYLCRQDATAK